MVITYSVILIGLLFLIRPLQKNSFYILHAALVILAAYYIETHYFRASVFGAKTLLLFVVFQFVSINVVTVLAYWVDKRAAVRGAWRVPEINLHTLEFLGGWRGATGPAPVSPQNEKTQLSVDVLVYPADAGRGRVRHTQVFGIALV